MTEKEAKLKAKNLRFKKPALADMGFYNIIDELCNITDDCEGMQYIVNDEDALEEVLDEEEIWEFKMQFAELSSEAYKLSAEINDAYCIEEYFDMCTTGIIGNRFALVGFDDYEEDYFSLCSYESMLATDEVKKKLLRLTKSELLAKIGQCVGILLSFHNVKQKFDNLSSVFDIMRGKNYTMLETIKAIEQAYEDKDISKLEELTRYIPERFWIE